MQRAVKRNLFGALAALLWLAPLAYGVPPAPNPPPYDTPRAAFAAWQKAETADQRQTIIAWLEEYALNAPSTTLPDALKHLGLVSTETDNRLERVSKKLLASSLPPETTALVVHQLADWRIAQQDYTTALDELLALLQNTTTPMTQKASTAHKAASLLSDQLARPSEAHELLIAVIAETQADPATVAPLLLLQADIYDRHLDDKAKAIANLQTIIAFGVNCSGADYTTAANRLAAILFNDGQSAAAATTLLALARHPQSSVTGLGQKLIGMAAPATCLVEALELLRTQINASFSNPTTFRTALQRLQPEVITLLLALQRTDEAIAECRAFAFVAQDRDYAKAIELAAQCLKACDGNLGRANALLAFHQQEAPPAGSRNPLLAFKPVTDPQRERLEKESQPPANWSDWLDRAVLAAWLDRPLDSIDAARSAFALCPMTTDALKKCTEAISRPILVATRDMALAQRVVDYLLFGVAGPDGQPDTADDLNDPFPEVRQRLAYHPPTPAGFQP